LTLYGLVLLIGILVGLEIPLIMRILKREVAFKDLVAQVLSFDYIGALAVSVLFPCCWRRTWGWCAARCCSACSMRWSPPGRCGCSAPRSGTLAVLRAQCVAVLGFLALGFGFAGHFVSLAEANLYNEDIVHAESSPYQRIVVTRWRDELRLYLNHNLQFSSRDEYRYHEALVHPGLAALTGARKCWCWAAATAWRCARSSNTRRSRASRWSTSIRA
jgi:spermidine synthase